MPQGTALVGLRFFTLMTVLLLILLGFTAAAQQNVCNGLVVLNLTSTNQVWCVPHVYQGDYNGQPVNTYPVYYGPSIAYQSYWSFAGISSNQPVLELVPAQTSSAGAMFWSGYYEGGPVTIMLVGTYTTGTWWWGWHPADGFEIYLFIKPSGWSTTNPSSNYTIPFYSPIVPHIAIGNTIIPYAMSGTKYIVIQWDPIWTYVSYKTGVHYGDWNVYVVTGNGHSTPNMTIIAAGVGSGGFEPNPGDLIVISITYYPNKNVINGYAYDISTGSSASFSYDLNGYFTPPSSGQYVFGIAADTGVSYANWGIMAVGEEGITYIPVTVNYTVTFTEEGLPEGAPWSVIINGTIKSSTTNEITFTLPPGTYVYSVSTNVTGYAPINSTGIIHVSGNETFTVLFAASNESSMLRIYSEYVEYFFTMFDEPNVFYVQAPSIDGSQPISVTGYITLNNEPVSFTYNPSIGMWESNTINMGLLPPGKGYLMVIAKYPNGQVLTNNYTIITIQIPAIIVTVFGITALTAPIKVPANTTFEYTFLPVKVGLYNNTFLIDSSLEIDLNESYTNVQTKYLSGEYGIGGFNIYLELIFSSNGTVDIFGKYKIFNLKGKVINYPIRIKDYVGATGTINVNYSDYTAELEDLSVNNHFFAAASFPLPTPLEFTIPVINVEIGIIPVLSVGIDFDIGAYFVPTNNPQQELRGIFPITLDSIHGHAFIPFGITGLFGGGEQEDDGGLGIYAWLQGVAGFGEYYQVYPAFSGKGGALLGELNVGATVNIIIFSWSGSFTVLGPGVLYQWGNITQSEISELELQLQKASAEFIEQATGTDWVNGSTFGLIASGLPLGYSYSAASYNGSMYVYYTVLLPNGYAWISGVIFRGTYEYPAPLPSFNDLGVASPYLIQLPNGTLMMVWFAVPRGNYGLNNLTIILQGSVLEPNGTWGPVFNITQGGVALSVTSDGRYLYVIWEPKLNLNYTNTELLMVSLTGQVIRALQLPNITALNGALNGNVAVQFINGTYAVVNMLTGGVTPYVGYSDVGFIDGLFYAFSNDTLTIINGTSKIVMPTPSEAYAWPSVVNGKLLVIAYRPSVLSVYMWNGTALLSISNYTLPNLVIAKPAYANGLIYITALTRVMNNSDPSADLWNIILSIPSAIPPVVSHVVLPPSSYFYLRVVAPDYANWIVYADASDGWYAYYSGSGSMVLGPAYVGQPGTTVTFNVTSLGDCPSPSVTYEPSNTLSLNNGANYETIVINCQPMLTVDFNITGGGGIIALISEPGLGATRLMLNGPTNYTITVPINTTITIYTWPNPSHTLTGIYINNTEVAYLEDIYGAYVYKMVVNSNQVVTIIFNKN